MYELPVKKTMLISIEQNKKLTHFCKLNRVSASQLFRLMIDELYFADPLPLKFAIQENTFKVQNFVSTDKPSQLIKESVNDGQGQTISRWFKPLWGNKSQIQREEINSYPMRRPDSKQYSPSER